MLIEHLQKSIELKRAQGKAATARRSEFCMRKLREYVGEGDVALSDITPQWLEGFQSWLTLDGSLKDNTASCYMRTVLSVCRAASKEEGAQVDLAAFKGCFTGNARSTRAELTAADYRKIKNLSLGKSAMFAKTRDMFMVSVLCCGLDAKTIVALRKSDIAGGFVKVASADGAREVPVCDEAWTILQRYNSEESLYYFINSATPLDPASIDSRCGEYLRRLEAVARIGDISKKVDDQSAAGLWASVAQSRGVKPAVINAATGRRMSMLAGENDVLTVSREDILTATATVSDVLNPRSVHWFAMKCIDRSREEVAAELSENWPAVDVFVPESASAGDKHARQGKSALDVIERTLFFRCLMSEAVAIKKPWRQGVYIYDYPSQHGRVPAIIPEADMKMFMYINEVDASKILYFFPEEAQCDPGFEIMDEVCVTEGKWKGAKGKYLGPCKNSKIMVYVAVEFPNLGIVAKAAIEKHFLAHSQMTDSNVKQ